MPRYYLPVSAEERELWTYKVPESIVNTADDFVNFHATGGKFARWLKVKEAEPNFLNDACYASCGPHYDTFEITCYPKNRKQLISLEQALEFFSIMSSHGIIPEGVKLWEEDNKEWKGVFCRLGEGLGNPHQHYAALTCYRWLDSHPPLVWEFLQIMGDGTPRHPLQILPYLIIKHANDWNHSFILSCVGGANGARGPACNPLTGLAGKIYFDPSDPRGSKLYEDPNHEVNEAIRKVCHIITSEIKCPQPAKWDKNFTVNLPKYVLRNTADGLHPGLYELYTIPKITKKQIGAILSKLFTEKKA